MSLFKHTIKDTIGNYINRWNAFKAYNQKGGDPISPPEDYKLQFSDDFNGPLDTDKWRLGQPWGNFHPGDLDQHYDLDGKETYVSVTGELVLELRHRPLHVIKSELPQWRQVDSLPDEFTIPYAIGLVTTKQSWQWGWFSAEIQLPRGRSLWPAFWLSGKNSWPPEIDIFEGYTKDTKDYTDKFLFKRRPHVKIQPNLHYGIVEQGTKQMYGAYDVPVYNATERFVQYVCHWEKDFIRIYYDGVMVFETTDKKVLDWYNKEGAEQFIILNNGSDDVMTPDESAMLIKNVRVYQKVV